MPGSTNRDSHPRLSSADIVAVTTEMRLRQQGRRNRGAKGKDDTDDAKRELVMEEHKQSPAEIFADLGSDPVNVSAALSCLFITHRSLTASCFH
jgi:hypothetical protein